MSISEFSDSSQREICRRIAKFPEDDVITFLDTFELEPEISASLEEKLRAFVSIAELESIFSYIGSQI